MERKKYEVYDAEELRTLPAGTLVWAHMVGNQNPGIRLVRTHSNDGCEFISRLSGKHIDATRLAWLAAVYVERQEVAA